MHFESSLLAWPENVSVGNPQSLTKGLGAAMLIAIYDYLGYYNVCHFVS